MTVITESSMMFGHVMHRRLWPVANSFRYGVYYIAFPLSQIGNLPIPHNRFGLLSYYDMDHGDGGNPEKWARGLLRRYKIKNADGEIIVVTMPRVLGYVFNPVSFWICHDRRGNVRAVLCEVNNTFGETHTYVCAHGRGRIIKQREVIRAKKLFHVSPFLEREGQYHFTFNLSRGKMHIAIINYKGGRKILASVLAGNFVPMNKDALRRAFWAYPLITLKAIFLIHAQAVKLALKGMKYIPRPRQRPENVSASDKIKDI